jgi:4-hydroxy-3-methylbut-2-en-1-yl diphosphate reductase
MEIIIDKKSGFCFGVERAIRIAEEQAQKNGMIYCLGDIVHNSEEINRLRQKGLEFITREEFLELSDCKVLIRAHGEPPETYDYAKSKNIELIDATCVVVIKLQDKIRQVQQIDNNAQIVIYGRKDHPEVIGLKGQVEKSVIIESIDELSRVDYNQPVYLFAQTTKYKEQYAAIKIEIIKRLEEAGLSKVDLIAANSICGQVANRSLWLSKFSRTVDALVFVGGKSSSNSRILFDLCRKVNRKSYFVTSVNELGPLEFDPTDRVGICGATSTPYWLLEEVAERLHTLYKAYIQ